MKSKIVENIKVIFYALIIAIIIRSLFFQPFYIPSSSMEPTLVVGDRLFVSKYSYGYGKHSFPFSPPISKERFFFKQPKRGDVVVFKTPVDNRTDYIKRLIGLPGDEIQFINGDLYLNNNQILKTKKDIKNLKIYCSDTTIDVVAYDEKLPNGVTYTSVYRSDGSFQNSDKYIVPEDHFFFLGDNRDCSKDSRYLNSVGYVNKLNLVGKARIIFFSTNKNKGNIFQIWKWFEIIQWDRLFDIID
jgi:signal peptidase I|tara:strand:- start:1513 stop:2244 length:732 start_codon:yes stop_codon:yes gene_type:complete